MTEPLYNVKRFGEDVAVPKNPEGEGRPRLMTITEIAKEHGVSRQTVHTYRRTGTFPSPVEGEGSTRPRFRADEVKAFFDANPKQPGKKRTPSPRQPQGTAMTKTQMKQPPGQASAQGHNEGVDNGDWRVPLKYTRQDLDALLESIEAGRYARMVIADHPEGGDTYVVAQGRGKSIRFNRLRVVDSPQYARDLAAVLLAWADREDADE
jgi:predicted DNA-binding transcriptional regulator AlpA